MSNKHHQSDHHQSDRGSIMVLTLVITVILAVVVAAVADYTTTGLRYGKTVEDRADRLAAADGGMRFAVEKLSLGSARVCATAGGDSIDPPDVNSSVVEVSCGQVGDGFHNTNGWALILTGEGVPPVTATGCNETVITPHGAVPRNRCNLLNTLSGNGDVKTVGGPIYLGELRIGAQSPIEFYNSELLYTAPDCTAPIDPAVFTNVTFDSKSLGPACTERVWSRTTSTGTVWSTTATSPDGLFTEPNIGVLPEAFLPDGVTPSPDFNPPFQDITDVPGSACRVYRPGYYTSAGVSLAQNNHFLSGNYVFDGVSMAIDSRAVTAGRSGGADGTGDAQFLDNDGCDDIRLGVDTGNTATTAGATFYLKNGSNFNIGSGGSFEILRRKQGSAYVSIHVLDTTMAWDDSVIFQQPGTNKDMAMHGLVWAPHANITFAQITNNANGQLLGGAVLSNVDLRSSAHSSGFVIAVEPSDLHGKLQLDSVAIKDGDSTTIRSIVDYRPSTNYTAVTSWRVID